ncbi:MAG: hypothetical protein V3T88_01550 [Nitrosomonadaceae bacterium]
MTDQQTSYFTFRNEDDKIKYIKSGRHKMAEIRKGWDEQEGGKKVTKD